MTTPADLAAWLRHQVDTWYGGVQERMARDMGVNRSAISRWLHGGLLAVAFFFAALERAGHEIRIVRVRRPKGWRPPWERRKRCWLPGDGPVREEDVP